jgi:DNA polymerase III delta subunit
MVRGLRAEGVNLFGLLAALTGQLRRLHAGGNAARLPAHKLRLLERFRKRLSASGADRALAACALVDAQGKGQLRGDPWLSLEALLLALAGHAALPPLEAQRSHLQRI